MIYLYPANKMESLLVLLDKIQQIDPLPVFTPELIIVQNPGMQHWLNMSLAKQRGIAMNTQFALPAQFLWKLLRQLVATGDDVQQDPFSREVLSWRIFALLTTEKVLSDNDFAEVNHYWQQGQQSELRCYQLACQLADLYEQYLIFRPEWIDNWHQQNFDLEDTVNLANDHCQQSYRWQGKLWALLTEEQSYNPLALIAQAKKQLPQSLSLLPKRISFFGINAMAPMWLDFINVLSDYTQVHFFHLNPCFDYWGDIVSEKQAMRQLAKWSQQDESHQDIGNPLLANLGQQGREFLSLLQQYSVINIDAFESLPTTSESDGNTQVLQSLQQDILTLTDKRQQAVNLVDDSVVFASCHSPLREVQALHDWLLHQFNQDSLLTPKDVLVMCPQVEDYAPYINAVFSRGWQDIDDKIPPLPCSIADRCSKDAEPLVAVFLDLLNLPDSRFQVSKLMALLRLPQTQAKFNISYESLDKIQFWLEQASVHWGIDQSHKAKVLANQAVSSMFTWQQGLSRLMRGFAFADHEAIFDDQLLLPYVEGEQATLLAQLMLFIEQLQQATVNLTNARSALQWQAYLQQLMAELFVVNGAVELSESVEVVFDALAKLVEYCQEAGFGNKITRDVVSNFLESHFSQPDAKRQFMVGQVTFCSMIPMRSIPFKVIAILGLNDGHYPRRRQPMGFDLMELTGSKLGDRSRRGDDRYLFLEALISARQHLYLSYQGRNIKNNKEQQSSLVLKELMDYLALGYGWDFKANSGQLKQLAMQPFSDKNFQSPSASFDYHWLKFAQPPQSTVASIEDEHLATELIELVTEHEPTMALSMAEIVSFYQHPSRYFSQRRLALKFDPHELELDDNEPFTVDSLAKYQLSQGLLSEALADLTIGEQALVESQQQLIIKAKLSGQFPELATINQHYDDWLQQSVTFSKVFKEFNQQPITRHTCQVTLPIVIDNKQLLVELTAAFEVSGDHIVAYRNTTAKAKDVFALYLSQLIVQYWQQSTALSNVTADPSIEQLTQVSYAVGFYFDTKSQKITSCQFNHLTDVKTHLTRIISTFIKGQDTPKLLNGELAHFRFNARQFDQAALAKFWQDPNSERSFGLDPYIRYFWPQCPLIEQLDGELVDIYQPIYQALEINSFNSKGQ